LIEVTRYLLFKKIAFAIAKSREKQKTNDFMLIRRRLPNPV